MALSSETESRIYRSLRAVSGVTAHLVSLGFTIFVAILARPGSSLFSWHPFLMALAVSRDIGLFSPTSRLLNSATGRGRVRVHWALQLLALLCALLGLAVITYNKHLNGKAHFGTWHGLTGLLTVLYAGLQCLGGAALLYPRLLRNWTLAKLKVYHATSGLVGYLLGCATLLLAMCSLWFTTAVPGLACSLCALCPVLTSLVIMNQVIDKTFWCGP
nr:cytochrome b561 domain-containing protein 2 [Pelodiscus sinensis]|eukprot:XP_014433871.1 cytochrome b561 domain-containing protein 2 [Pelodiscus sinensis]